MPSAEQNESLSHELQPLPASPVPTLLAGSSEATHGNVQVWAPSLRDVRAVTARNLGSWTALVLICFLPFYLSVGHNILVALFGAVFWLMGTLITLVGRPPAIAADDLGMAIEGDGQKHYLRWEDVAALLDSGPLILFLRSGDRITLNLHKYRQSARKALIARILRSCDLLPDPDDSPLAKLRGLSDNEIFACYIRRGLTPVLTQTGLSTQSLGFAPAAPALQSDSTVER